ncbi:hypothetical protein GCM10009539_03230 [Cryptosporangium japonicum]|uniref:Response regulatory domain-containing protein n=1 Tax=Cryptosporangium japonicum TaxID=80872 RepID=A0ABN0TGU8_9ACTN
MDVLIADDHAPFRSGLRALLASVEDIDLVGEAADGESAVALATRLQPDVVLMDLHMPGLDGIEATRRIVATSPHIGIVVLTMLEDDAGPVAEDRAQPRLEHLRQTAGRRSGRGDRPRPRRGPRAPVISGFSPPAPSPRSCRPGRPWWPRAWPR